MKNAPSSPRANRKSKLLLLVPCALIVIAIVMWIYLFLGSHHE